MNRATTNPKNGQLCGQFIVIKWIVLTKQTPEVCPQCSFRHLAKSSRRPKPPWPLARNVISSASVHHPCRSHGVDVTQMRLARAESTWATLPPGGEFLLTPPLGLALFFDPLRGHCLSLH